MKIIYKEDRPFPWCEYCDGGKDLINEDFDFLEDGDREVNMSQWISNGKLITEYDDPANVHQVITKIKACPKCGRRGGKYMKEVNLI